MEGVTSLYDVVWDMDLECISSSGLEILVQDLQLPV